MRGTARARWLLALAAVVAPAAALAQGEDPRSELPEVPTRTEEEPPAVPITTDDDPPAVPTTTDEELRAIEAALASDLAGPSSTAPSTSGSAPAGGTMGLPLDVALILDVAGAWFSDEGAQRQTGGHDPQRTGFNLQQLELSLGSAVDPYFRFDANLVFAEFGVELEEAYATTLVAPANLQFRAGQFLSRFGRLNPSHPHGWSFVDQPIVNGTFFGSEGARGLGLEVAWLSPLPWYAELIVSSQNAGGECCARSFFGGDDLGVRTPADLLHTVALRQFFPLSPSAGVLWGLSGQLGPNPTGNGNRTEIWGTDLHVRYRPVDSSRRTALTWQTEWMMRRRQVPDDVLVDQGGYTQLVWQFDPHWETGVREEYLGGVADDPLDPDAPRDRLRHSAQITWLPSHFSRLRIQGALDDAFDDAPRVWSTFLALEVVTGTHGAHSY